MSNTYCRRKVEAIEVKEKGPSQLLAEMSRTANQGRRLGEVVKVWEAMLKEKDLTICHLGHNRCASLNEAAYHDAL